MRKNVFSLSHPTCSILLWQPKQIYTKNVAESQRCNFIITTTTNRKGFQDAKDLRDERQNLPDDISVYLFARAEWLRMLLMLNLNCIHILRDCLRFVKYFLKIQFKRLLLLKIQYGRLEIATIKILSAELNEPLVS